MKQRITVEQLNELTDDQKERLIEWHQSVGDYTRRPLLSIGQMIELLHDKQNYFEIRSHSVGFVFYDELNNKDKVAELADALWEAIKIVL